MLKTRSLGVKTFWRLQKHCYATDPKDVLGDVEFGEVPVFEDKPKYDEEEVARIRNKSRLEPQHRNMLQDEAPYQEPMEFYHNFVWYRRRILGRYGMNAPMVNPKYCWPTKEEVEDIKEYESCLYPKTIREVWKDIEEKKIQDAKEIEEREKHIDSVTANFDKWQKALQAKKEKKEADLLAAKQRKEAMLEEVREHFGYYIDSRDERFQEMLDKKEKEDKKKKKEEKKKAKRDKMMAFIAQAAQKPLINVETTEEKSTEEKKVSSVEKKSTEDKSEKTD